MKHCVKCLEDLPLHCFTVTDKRTGRLRNTCNKCRAIAAKIYYMSNKEKCKASAKKWDMANVEKLRAYKNNWEKSRTRTDPIYKLNKTMRHRLYKILRGTGSWTKLQNKLGYSTEELKSHLEQQFTEGMSWDNHGKWHIDHIIPLCYFTEVHQVREAWGLQNLQPLWASDNLKKGRKVCPALR